MLRTQPGLRVLGPSDLPDVLELLATDPVRNVFVEYRARLTRLDPRWLGGEVWGFYEDGELRSVCHAAANLVPVLGDDGGAGRLRPPRDPSRTRVLDDRRAAGRRCGCCGSRSRERWGTPREARWDQPHLELAGEPAVAPDPLVRRSEQADLDALYPACVDMYTEEVGISPEWDGGRDLYRARVNQLVSRGLVVRPLSRTAGWSSRRRSPCASPYACQIQGVYVDPSRRGEGLAAAGHGRGRADRAARHRAGRLALRQRAQRCRATRRTTGSASCRPARSPPSCSEARPALRGVWTARCRLGRRSTWCLCPAYEMNRLALQGRSSMRQRREVPDPDSRRGIAVGLGLAGYAPARSPQQERTPTSTTTGIATTGITSKGHAEGLPGGFKHLVVIYEENHSFDNLYGSWGEVDGQHVDGLCRRHARPHAPRSRQDGTRLRLPAAERRQPGVAAAAELTATDAGARHRRPATSPTTRSTSTTTSGPTDTTCPAPGRLRRPTASSKGTGRARRLHPRPGAPLLPGAVPDQRRQAEPLRRPAATRSA